MAISRKPISIKDVAFRTSFGLGPEKTENQGPNRERKAGGWGESMVWRGVLKRCETGANPLETRGKRKPVTPENDPRETGLSFLNGGGGGNRTRVRRCVHVCLYVRSPSIEIRRPGTRRARFPGSLGGVDTRRRSLRRTSALRPAVVALSL